MKVATAKRRLLQFIESKAPHLSSLSPADGIAEMLALYLEERDDGCEIDEDGDMLLYQWGCHDWGHGEMFEFNITRQFMDAADEDEVIWHLTLTFKFEPNDSLRSLAAGNRWCHSPDEIEDFRVFIESSPAYRTVADAKPDEVALDMQRAD